MALHLLSASRGSIHYLSVLYFHSHLGCHLRSSVIVGFGCNEVAYCNQLDITYLYRVSIVLFLFFFCFVDSEAHSKVMKIQRFLVSCHYTLIKKSL